jgi:uncharacterized protein (DUF302 family)
MRYLFSSLLVLASLWLCAQNLTIYRSDKSVSQTTEEIVSIIKSKNLLYFETVSYDSIASKRGVSIAPTQVISFEDPDLSSKLITCEKTTALDLPLKILVWEENEDVYIGFLDPVLMRRRFLIKGCDDTLAEMTSLMVRIINEMLKEG